MGNSPRYVGFIDPPYIVTLTDDSGAALNLTGCTSNSFTLTMLNQNTGLSQQGVGVWTITDATNGKASYQWTTNDMATAGPWWIYSTVKLPAEPSPREFDPELILILPGTVGAGAAPPGVLPNPAQSLPFLNIRDYGGIGDNASDNTIPIANARAAARALGGARIVYGPGVFLSKNQDFHLDNLAIHEGMGPGITTLKLMNNTNADLFSAYTSSINLASSPQSGSNVGVTFFGFRNMTLDGNKANQTSGPSYCMRAYGYGHVLEHVEIINGYSGGVLLDWNGSANPVSPANAFMPRWYDVMAHDNNGIGIQLGGPTDQEYLGVNGFANGSHNLHLAPNCVSAQMTNCHFWAPALGVGAVGVLIEAGGCTLENFISEGSDTCQLVILGNDTKWSGQLYAFPPTRNGRGLQLGQPAGGTPIPGQIYQSGGVRTAAAANVGMFSGKIRNCNAGAIDEQNTGSNIYQLNIYQTGGTGIVGGYPNQFSAGMITVEGLTLDGSPGTGGIFQLANVNSFNGFRIFDKNGSLMFNVDTYDSVFAIDNGRTFTGYSDAGVTPKYTLNAADGSLVLGNASALRSGSGVPSNSMGNNGDIYFRQDTPNVANQRMYVKSAGAWVGIA